MASKDLTDFDEIYGNANTFITAKLVIDNDLQGTYTITEATVVEIPQGEGDKTKKRLGLTFDELENYMLPLNVTNAKILSEKWGKDYRKWKGKKLEIKTAKVNFKGKLVDSVIVEPK